MRDFIIRFNTNGLGLRQVVSERVHFDWINFLSVILDPVVIDRGQSLLIPPVFDGTNYVYWKVRMKVFLQALGEQVWQAVEVGWIKPKEVPVDWDEATIIMVNFNSRALNALFCGLTNEEFKKISSTEVANEE